MPVFFVAWVKPPQNIDDVELWIDIAAYDASWRRDPCYVGARASGGSEHKYRRIGEELVREAALVMPLASLDDGGVAGFTDGRHRFAWMRDHGAKAIPVMVAPDQNDVVHHRFGSDLRETRIRI